MNNQSTSLKYPIDTQALAAFIDHTILKPDAREEQIHLLCQEARQYHFASVCVNPYWVSFCEQQLRGTGIPVCTVVGFPLGANRTEIKAQEAKLAVADGAREIDMVMNVGQLKSGQFDGVQADIAAVVEASTPYLVKVILETCLLNDEEIIRACKIAKAAGALFVKTSTGFGATGATVDHIRIMRQVVGENIGVKASGGIRDLATALDMVRAGANRLGTSASVSIIASAKELEEK